MNFLYIVFLLLASHSFIMHGMEIKKLLNIPDSNFDTISMYDAELKQIISSISFDVIPLIHQINNDYLAKKCPYCDAFYKRKIDLKIHLELAHYICKDCNHQCSDEATLNEHLSTHERYLYYKAYCNNCYTVFEHRYKHVVLRDIKKHHNLYHRNLRYNHQSFRLQNHQ